MSKRHGSEVHPTASWFDSSRIRLRITLNPVLVIISIVFWYWMWGVAGALLAVQLLATLKIICDRIRSLAALGHFLGAEARN